MNMSTWTLQCPPRAYPGFFLGQATNFKKKYFSVLYIFIFKLTLIYSRRFIEELSGIPFFIYCAFLSSRYQKFMERQLFPLAVYKFKKSQKNRVSAQIFSNFFWHAAIDNILFIKQN